EQTHAYPLDPFDLALPHGPGKDHAEVPLSLPVSGQDLLRLELKRDLVSPDQDVQPLLPLPAGPPAQDLDVETLRRRQIRHRNRKVERVARRHLRAPCSRDPRPRAWPGCGRIATAPCR